MPARVHPGVLLPILLAACASGAGGGADAASDLAADAPDAYVAPDLGPGGLAFPAGFRWGVATSAFQTEGHVENDYTDWIAAGKSPALGVACDAWNRWREDVTLAAGLGVQVFRMSIEWARIEPEEGRFDDAALAHYREVLAAVRAAGMEPLVTLHHFTNPRWLAASGGWSDARVVDRFRRYAARVATGLGDLVDAWNPQNEGMVYVSGLTLVDTFPNGSVLDFGRLRTMLYHTVFANAAAADALREADRTDADGDGKPAVVWLVHAVSPAYPSDPTDPQGVEIAKKYGYFYNHLLPRALITGDLDLNADHDLTGVFGEAVEGHYPALAGRVDVLGLNYYSREFIAPAPGLMDNLEALPCLAALSCGDRTGVEGDNGNEVYPAGLYEALKEFAAYGLPMAVSENGVSDADDDLRPSYLVMHLMQVHRAIAEGLDVRAYLHWSLLDNYEWTSGYDQKFGLHAVDFATLARTARPSAGLYREIVAGNGLTAAQVARWDRPAINPR